MDPRQIAAELRALADQLDPLPEASAGPLAPGDLVQLRPDANPTWGGMLARVTRRTPYEVRGYLLTPHRGGCREAWLRLRPPLVVRVGREVYEQPEWGMRKYCATEQCAAERARGARRDRRLA